MSSIFRKFWEGLSLKPRTSTIANEKGDLEVISSTGKLQYHNGTTVSPVVTADHSETLTNKTIVVDNAVSGNTITTKAVGNLAAVELNAALNELQGDIDTINGKIGAVNGLATLDGGGKVPATQLPNSVMEFQGYFNPNTTGLVNGTGNPGDVWEADTVGSRDFGAGAISFKIGDWAVYAAGVWHKSLNSNEVTSVAGKTGTVTLTSSDVGLGNVDNTSDATKNAASVALTNKTIDASSNTISNIDLSNMKTVVGNAGKVVQYDGSGVPTSSKTLSGMSLEIPTRSDVKQDTRANLNTYASTAANGQLVFATDTKEYLAVKDGVLVAVGGGNSDPSVYVTLQSDSDNDTWLSGNNASFLGGGSIAGTFTKKNATTPLNGTYSYTLVQAAGSLNDYVASAVQAVPLRSRGVTNRTNLVYTYDGNDNDIKWIVYDVTNTTIVTPSTAYVVTSSVGKQVELVYDLPSTCTQVRFGLQVLVANNGKTLKFDDVQMSDQPFTTANLVDVQSGRYDTYAGMGSTNNKIPYFTNSATIPNNSPTIVTVGNDSTNGFSITALKPCILNITYNKCTSSGGNGNTGLSLNSNQLTTAFPSITQANKIAHASSVVSGVDYAVVNVSASVKLNTGDVVRPHTDGTTPYQTVSNFLTFTATAISSNIIQTWQDGTEWTTLTYTEVNALTGNQGLGTFTAGGVEWMRGKDGLLHYKGKLTIGTVSASEARIPLPNGLISADTTKIPSIQLCGYLTRSDLGTSAFTTLIEPSVGYFTLGAQNSAAGGLTKTNGNATFNSGTSISFFLTIPIRGWSSSPTILALPSATQTDYYLEAAGNAGQSITANVTDIPFIATTQNNLTWDGSGFTAPISGNYEVMGNVILSSSNSAACKLHLYVNGSQTKVVHYINSSVSSRTFSGKVYLTAGQRLSLRSDIAATLLNDTLHTISITRLNGKNDSVYVANYQPDYDYDLTVTGTNFTNIRSVGVIYKTGRGSYRLRFNITCSVTSQSSNTLTISGVTFKNVSSNYQAVTVLAGSIPGAGYVNPNASTISISSTASVTGWYISGDVEIESKPSWATFTP